MSLCSAIMENIRTITLTETTEDVFQNSDISNFAYLKGLWRLWYSFVCVF